MSEKPTTAEQFMRSAPAFAAGDLPRTSAVYKASTVVAVAEQYAAHVAHRLTKTALNMLSQGLCEQHRGLAERMEYEAFRERETANGCRWCLERECKALRDENEFLLKQLQIEIENHDADEYTEALAWILREAEKKRQGRGSTHLAPRPVEQPEPAEPVEYVDDGA